MRRKARGMADPVVVESANTDGGQTQGLGLKADILSGVADLYMDVAACPRAVAPGGPVEHGRNQKHDGRLSQDRLRQRVAAQVLPHIFVRDPGEHVLTREVAVQAGVKPVDRPNGCDDLERERRPSRRGSAKTPSGVRDSLGGPQQLPQLGEGERARGEPSDGAARRDGLLQREVPLEVRRREGYQFFGHVRWPPSRRARPGSRFSWPGPSPGRCLIEKDLGRKGQGIK